MKRIKLFYRAGTLLILSILLNACWKSYSYEYSLLLSFTLSIPDTNSLPFYPQYIQMQVSTGNQDSASQALIWAGRIYFTPYNTIEIWNLEDYYDLKRCLTL